MLDLLDCVIEQFSTIYWSYQSQSGPTLLHISGLA